jgi:hypothetical protein
MIRIEAGTRVIEREDKPLMLTPDRLFRFSGVAATLVAWAGGFGSGATHHPPLAFEAGNSAEAPYFARGVGFTAYFGPSRVTVDTAAGPFAVLFHGTASGLWMVTEEGPSGDTDRSQLRFGELYPGIDLLFHGRVDALEHTFIVRPRSSPSVIEIEFEGVTVIVEPDGSLSLVRRAQLVWRHRSCFYQEKAGARREVAGRYIGSGPGRVRFAVGPYDRTAQLYIN